MERVNTSFEFSILERTLFGLSEDHANTTLARIKDELNKFFVKSKCKEVLYTNNTDNLFFGIRVYPSIDGSKAIELLGDNEPEVFDSYSVEIDSKLMDPITDLTGKELTALLIYNIYYTIYNPAIIDQVKFTIDAYFASSGEYIALSSSKGFRELLAYAIKDAMMKAGSLFTKRNGDAVIQDPFISDFGYTADMDTALHKIVTSISYMAKEVDDRFIVLSWVLRVGREYEYMQVPAYKTLVKAAQLTGSRLEKRELEYAARIINSMEEPVHEGFIDGIKERFSNSVMKWKRNGIRGIKSDVFELQLRLRTAEDVEELMSIIRAINSKIAILQDYLTENISDAEREDVTEVLQTLYTMRQEASADKAVKSRYSGYIQVTYPDVN